MNTAEALAAAKKRIIELQSQMTDRILKLATEIGKLTELTTERDAREFLRATCNLQATELSTFVKFKSTLAGSEDTLREARASFRVVKALVAADEETRAELLERMSIGARIGTREIFAIRRQLREAKLLPEQVLSEKRGKLASAAARVQAKAVAEAFKKRIGSFAGELSYDGSGTDTRQIRQRAAEIRKEFESFFGVSHRSPDDHPAVSQKRDLSLAHLTLLQIEDGTLQAERALTGRERGLRHPGILALRRLSGNAFVRSGWEAPAITQQPPPHHRLKAIELCAGAGGMALGLEAAGFEHVALVEFDKHAAATLRANRPGWNVFKCDMREVDFRPYRKMDIDLVSGGLPCQPFSIEGNALGKDDPRDLFPDSIRVIHQVRPKAFAFENVSGLLHAKHSEHVANILKGYRKAGYQVEIHRMQAADYGIAQTRSRILIVGLRNDVAAVYRMPPRFPHRRADLGSTLLDLMSANGWDGREWARQRSEQPIVDRDGNVIAFGAQASTVVTSRGKRKRNDAASQKARGFDSTGMPTRAPTAEEASAEGYLPQLTLAMRARIQDFPDEWIFIGGRQATAKQIGNAVPRRMAQAVGLSIYAAIKGIRWDMEAMLWPEVRVTTTAPPLVPEYLDAPKNTANMLREHLS